MEEISWEGIIVALVASSAAAIYVLGLVALGLPVYRRITGNSSTALYVVSLVPKTVVAGHGVRFLVGLPLIWALLFAASLSVPQLVHRGIEDVDSIPAGAIPAVVQELPIFVSITTAVVQELPVIVSIAIVLFILGLHETIRAAGLYDVFYPSLNDPTGSSRVTFRLPRILRVVVRNANFIQGEDVPKFTLSLVIANVIGCIGGAIGAWILVAEGWNAGPKALVVVFFINIVANVLAVVSIAPPMPQVSVKTKDASETELGNLLAHSEGHWYIFDEKYNRLKVIPDDKAEEVEVIYKISYPDDTAEEVETLNKTL